MVYVFLLKTYSNKIPYPNHIRGGVDGAIQSLKEGQERRWRSWLQMARGFIEKNGS